MVASSPVIHEPNMAHQPISIQSYQQPWGSPEEMDRQRLPLGFTMRDHLTGQGPPQSHLPPYPSHPHLPGGHPFFGEPMHRQTEVPQNEDEMVIVYIMTLLT